MQRETIRSRYGPLHGGRCIVIVRSDYLLVEGDQLCGLAWLDGLLWYSDAALAAITAVDPRTGDRITRLPCPQVRAGLAAADGGGQLIRVAGPDRRLRVLDPYAGREVAEYPNPRPGARLCGLHDTPGGTWMAFGQPPVLDLRRHTDLDTILSIPLDEVVADVTVAGGALVVADQQAGRLNVLDPETGEVGTRLQVAGHPAGLTWDGHRLWYCDFAGGRLCSVEVEPADLGFPA